jgi:hypothetical protein
MRAFAIKRLVDLTSCIDKIVLAREYDVDEWLKGAYVEVCKMDKLPSDEDCDRLGFDLFKKIARARESVRVSPSNKNAVIEVVVEDLFGLAPSLPIESVLSTPTSRPASPRPCFARAPGKCAEIWSSTPVAEPTSPSDSSRFVGLQKNSKKVSGRKTASSIVVPT